jgi:hypothetical protein
MKAEEILEKGPSMDRDTPAEWVPLDELVPWSENPRANDAAVAAVAESIERWGWGAVILARKANREVIAGHTRLKAAQKLNLAKVPVRYLDLSESEAHALALADNRVGELAAWDDSLDEVVRALEADGVDLSSLGWSSDELADMLALPAAPDDTVPEVPEVADSVLGHVYELGPHRLICGDCGDAGVVASLMGDDLADACVTDPPYGQDQPGVTNDSPEALSDVVGGAIARMPMSNGVCVAFSSPRTFPEWLDATRAGGHKFERMLWMYKEAQMANPWRGWILKSEAILVSTVGKGAWQEVHPYAHDCYKLASVSSKSSGFDASAHGWHGSVKPLAVVEDLVSRVCPRGGVLYEPFGGSGTTLIACARLGVLARVVELDPGYCDVIRRRWTTYALANDLDPGTGALE